MSELPPEVLIDRDQILPDSSQPRKVFDEEAIKALRDDIKANGLKEPIDINPLLDGRSTKYLTIDGECRTKATDGLEGYEQLPCRLYKYKSQREIDKHRASKHFHRKDWNPADRAVWLKYYMETHKLRQQDLAREFSVKQSVVSEWLAPTRDAGILKALRNGEIGFKQAVLLSRLDDAESRENALRESIGKTKRDTEEIIAQAIIEPETEKEEESESEITDREALIASIPEELQERLLDATKDLSLHDTRRIVKQTDMGVRIDEAIRAVKLSRTPEIQVAEGALPEENGGRTHQLPDPSGKSSSETVNDGEGETTENSGEPLQPPPPETSSIIADGFAKGGEKGTETEGYETDSPRATQSPLPEGGTVITPDIGPPPETKVVKFVNRMLRLGEATTTHMKEKELEELADCDYRKTLKNYEQASFEIETFRDFLQGRENNGSVQYNREKRLHNALRECDPHAISSAKEATDLKSMKIKTKKKLTADLNVLDNIINAKKPASQEGV